MDIEEERRAFEEDRARRKRVSERRARRRRRRRIKAITAAAASVGLLIAGGVFVAQQRPDQPTRLAQEPAATAAPTVTASAASEPLSLRTLGARLRAGQPVDVLALGSSVGVGATLPQPVAQAPVGRLVSELRRKIPKAAIRVDDQSENGTIAIEGLRRYEALDVASRPDVLVLAYGMNDGLTGNYNTGQTLPGGIRSLSRLMRLAKQDGVLVVVFTTVSPHTERTTWLMPPGTKVGYPSGGKPLPLPESSVVLVDGQPFSARHQEWNRRVVESAAAVSGVELLDVAPSWVQAEAQYGQDRLFNEREYVHPNLLGHQQSYWKAIDRLVARL